MDPLIKSILKHFLSFQRKYLVSISQIKYPYIYHLSVSIYPSIIIYHLSILQMIYDLLQIIYQIILVIFRSLVEF